MPGDEPLGLAGDLLRIDGVGVDAGDRAGLGVAGPFQRRVALPDLRLELFASSGVVGDRPEGRNGGRLLLHLQGCPVAQLGNAATGLPGRKGRDLDLQRRDLLPARLLAREQLLGRCDIRHAKLAQDVLDPGLGHAQTFLGPDATLAPQRPIPLARLVDAAHVHRHGTPLPEPNRREDRDAQADEPDSDDRHERLEDPERDRNSGGDEHGQRQDSGQQVFRLGLVRLDIRAQISLEGLLQDRDTALQRPHPVELVA